MATISRTATATRLSVVASTLVLLTTFVTAANPHAARAASSTTTHTQNHKKRVTCEDVHIFLARGWNEDYPGRQGALVDAICAGQDTSSSSSCGYEDVIFDDSPSSVYGTAVYQGAVAGISQVNNYATECPDAKIVLSGYSEGAHVLGDVLAGGGGEWFGSTEDDVTGFASVTTSPGSQIKAALLWGDPRHTASQSYNVLTGADANGIYPRSGTNLDNLDIFSSVLRSYCLSGDKVCAGGDEDSAHVSYFEDSVGLVDDAASWVRSMVGISGTATATTTVQADSPATDGAAVMSSSSSSTLSAGGSLSTVTGTAALATATGQSDQASSGSGNALTSSTSTSGSSSTGASATSTSSPSSGVAKSVGGGQGLVMGVTGMALGTTWFLMQV